jgi:predicted SnoaL-like aldol condensation-catalyzing enzyme
MLQNREDRMPHSETEQQNLALVLGFYENVLIAMDPDRVDDYLAPSYIQHSTLAEPGIPALKAWLTRVRTESPDARQRIWRSLVDGNHVVVHVHVARWEGDPGLAVIDIFRVENGLIAEHWDVIQEVPGLPLNPNGMF